MGIMDNITTAVNKGTASAERTAKTARLKSRLKDLASQRQGLAAQLGASLYEVTKDNPDFRKDREQLYDGIAAIDEQRAIAEGEIAAIEEQAKVSQATSAVYTCPKCNSKVQGNQSFCIGCGMPVSQIVATPVETAASSLNGLICLVCGSPMEQDDLFCMTCGTKREVPIDEDKPADKPDSAAEKSDITQQQEPNLTSEK